mmetsp:Transcript_11532/g.25584  ORF Transcript_11532/g.25584 Transcript_11532/m.25584 type:complete len:98 (+) Transcript_11532:4092-4385(+)
MRVCSTVRLSPRRVKSLPKFVLAYEHSRVSGRLAPIVRRGATAFLLSQAQGSTMNQPGSFSWIAGVPFFFLARLMCSGLNCRCPVQWVAASGLLANQ